MIGNIGHCYKIKSNMYYVFTNAGLETNIYESNIFIQMYSHNKILSQCLLLLIFFSKFKTSSKLPCCSFDIPIKASQMGNYSL